MDFVNFLSRKNILILSPQPWEHLHLSKHHYAEELARAGNKVVFLNPPVQWGAPVSIGEVANNLSVARWGLFAPTILRFHAMPLYRRLVKRDVRRIERAVGQVDLVWAFDFNTFPDLSTFNAETLVFQPVDPISAGPQVECGLSADLVVSISKEILSTFDDVRFGSRKLLVEHGLSSAFAAEAARAPVERQAGAPTRVGFFGNLDRAVLNHRTLAALAAQHPRAEFHFWGPAVPGGRFMKALSAYENVIWHGALSKAELVEAIRYMDVFLLVYGTDYTYDRSNAHKLLEYLATGKVIVSSPISRYKDRPDLIVAPKADDDDDDAILPLFSAVLENLGFYNSRRAMAVRQAYAAQHTYRAVIEKIDQHLAQRVGARAVDRVC